MYNVSFELHATPYYYPSPDAIEFELFKKKYVWPFLRPQALLCLVYVVFCRISVIERQLQLGSVHLSPPMLSYCKLPGTERLRPHALKPVLELQQLAFAANVDISAAQKLQW